VKAARHKPNRPTTESVEAVRLLEEVGSKDETSSPMCCRKHNIFYSTNLMMAIAKVAKAHPMDIHQVLVRYAG